MIASAVALHEAGHALVAVALGVPAPSLVRMTDDLHETGSAHFRFAGWVPSPLVAAAIAWAGPLGEGSEPEGQDHEALEALAAEHGPQLVAQARTLADKLLNQHEDTLDRLARQLERQGSLPAYKVAGLLAPVRAASRGMLR